MSKVGMHEFWNSVWKKETLYYSKKETNNVPWDIKSPDTNLKKFLEKFNKPLNILEVGCGNGNDAYYMSEKGHNVTAIDISDYAIDEAKSLYKNDNLKFITSDFFKFKTTDKYDLIFDRGFIHNFSVDYFSIYFDKLYSLLKDKGDVLILSGNYNEVRKNKKDVTPNGIYLKDIEEYSMFYFYIKKIKEIILKQNSNYIENPLGWLILLEKREQMLKNFDLQIEEEKDENIFF